MKLGKGTVRLTLSGSSLASVFLLRPLRSVGSVPEQIQSLPGGKKPATYTFAECPYNRRSYISYLIQEPFKVGIADDNLKSIMIMTIYQ